MKRLHTAAAKLRAACKGVGRFFVRQPFAVPALLAGLAAACIAAGLPFRLESLVNALSFAVARRIAGTGITEPAPLRAEALTLLKFTAAAAILYLISLWLARRSARRAQTDLRAAVQAKRERYVEQGFTPPDNWETDVKKDIRRLCVMIASLPEVLLLVAGFVFCLKLLPRLPSVAAFALPLTAISVCYAAEALRLRRASRAAQTTAASALWAAGALIALTSLLRQTPNSLLLGTVVLTLLATAVIVPAALLLPWRSVLPAWGAFRRIRSFLK